MYQQPDPRQPQQPWQQPGPPPGPHPGVAGPQYQVPYSPQPGYGAPVPPAPPRKGRGGLVVGVALLVVALVGGGYFAWRYLQSDSDPDSPGTQPKGLVVEDTESGIDYELPEGWVEQDSGDLIDAFTTAASNGSASVFAFYGDAMTGEEMSYTTSTIAGENSEYFYPFAEDRQILISEPTEVDGQDAYRFTWEVSSEGEEPMYGHIVHILTDDDRSVFLMGIVHPDDADLRTEIDAIVSSVTLR